MGDNEKVLFNEDSLKISILYDDYGYGLSFETSTERKLIYFTRNEIFELVDGIEEFVFGLEIKRTD